MRKLLTLTCCVGLASLVGAAQHDDQNQNKNKRKGGNVQGAQQQQVVTPQTGKKFKTGPAGNPHYNAQNFQQQGGVNYNKKGKWQGQTQTNIDANASNTKFNKTKFAKQGNVGGKNFKFQKKQFNLQTNNKQFIVNKYKTVNFNPNYKIAGANKWKGAKYQVFVNYHPIWHDAWWYNSYHPHIVFIYGGWYYWDNSYWYPAWGYAPDAVYAYDGPIYASSPAEDPGQVVANVQSALQEQGYYQGEIDGVLGPQTRAALAEYQSAQGLEPTGLVDEPTLETLGMT
jgi:Putative peptidoglycan binding domain